MNFIKQKLNERGFTIVEVVLVLAIAGLIFLIVFLALPQLQRSRRDTQRRSDVGRILAAAETWSASNNGNYPAAGTEITTFRTQLETNNNVNDPNGNYLWQLTAGAAPTVGASNQAQLRMSRGTCGTAGAVTSGTARQFAVSVALEGGGAYCEDTI